MINNNPFYIYIYVDLNIQGIFAFVCGEWGGGGRPSVIQQIECCRGRPFWRSELRNQAEIRRCPGRLEIQKVLEIDVFFFVCIDVSHHHRLSYT